jgi:hypothetical protein
MGGLKLRFDLPFGLTALNRGLDRFTNRAQDLTPVWEQIISDLRRITADRFDAEGPGWAPLSARYAAQKAITHPGRPILVRTGELRRDLVDDPDVREATPTRMAYGTRVVRYGVHHQTGTGRMPARPPFGKISEAQKRAWIKMAQRYIVEGYSSRALTRSAA